MNRYEKYKPSGIEWIGEIPEHWEVKRFRYLFSFSRGLSITKENLQEAGIPCVSYGEIHSKYGFEVNPAKQRLKCVSEEYIQLSPNSLLKNGYFIFADTSEDIEGSGNFTYLNSNIPTFAGYHTIIAKPVQEFKHRYLAYLFDSLDFRTQIRRLVNGTKVYSITQSILKETVLLLPPLEEQTAIANYLDAKTEQSDKLIANKQQLIELLKEERTAIINEAVSGEGKNWERKKIKFVAKKVQTGSTPPSNETKYFSDEVNWFTPSDFSENLLLKDSKRKLSKFAILDGFVKTIPACSVLFVGIGATLGKVGYILSPATSNQQINSLQFSSVNEAIFYSYYFYTNQPNIINLANAATLPILNQSQMKEILLPVPNSKNELNDTVHLILSEEKRINNVIYKIDNEIKLIQEYRTSLISEVVTGKQKVI